MSFVKDLHTDEEMASAVAVLFSRSLKISSA